MDPKVTELYNDYIHGDMPRRSFLKQLAVITGGATVVPVHHSLGLANNRLPVKRVFLWRCIMSCAPLVRTQHAE